MSEVVHTGYKWRGAEAIEAVCITVGDVLDDDPRYIVVDTDADTIRIPHDRVIAIVEPKETP